jgi:hypothetical protein
VSCRLQVLPIASELRLFGATIIGTVDVTELIRSAAFPQFVMFRLSVPGVPIRIGRKSIKLVPKQTDGAAVAKSSLLMKLCKMFAVKHKVDASTNILVFQLPILRYLSKPSRRLIPAKIVGISPQQFFASHRRTRIRTAPSNLHFRGRRFAPGKNHVHSIHREERFHSRTPTEGTTARASHSVRWLGRELRQGRCSTKLA